MARSYYEDRVLDQYLRFDSAKDEEDYRKREETNRRAIALELAKGTPEGDRRAREIMEKQLLDAKDHGADASPDFAPMLAKVQSAEAGIATARAANDQPAIQQGEAKAPADTALGDVLATLQAAGVTALEPADRVDHGLAGSTPPTRTPGNDRSLA
ncbi:MAG: hypothetical protein V4808_12525 [Pseudomonadota bacterium]